MKQALTALFVLMISTSPAWAADSFAPWDFNAAPAKGDPRGQEMSPGAKLLVLAVNFYRETISHVDGERCRMYPSCSAYSLEAIKKHGFFSGYVMTADRLIHESNEMDHAPKIILKNGKERYYDPVGSNDFWWTQQ